MRASGLGIALYMSRCATAARQVSEQSANAGFIPGVSHAIVGVMSSFSDEDAFEGAVPLSQRAMAARPAPYLDDLNPAQRDAALTVNGRC